MKDLAEILDDLERRGYTAGHIQSGRMRLKSRSHDATSVALVDTITADFGTDPGDDVTVYLLRADDGSLGYLVMPDSWHGDPEKSRFVDTVAARRIRP